MGIAKWAADEIRKKLSTSTAKEAPAPTSIPELPATTEKVDQIAEITSDKVRGTIEGLSSVVTTYSALDSLDELNTKLIKKYKNRQEADISYEVEGFDEDRKVFFHTYGPDSNKEFKQEVETSDGVKIKTLFYISYHRDHVPEDERESYLEYEITNQRGEKTTYKFEFHPRLKIQSAGKGQIVWGIKNDGLHLKSSLQFEWAQRWEDFSRLLGENEVFREARWNMGEDPLKKLGRFIFLQDFREFDPVKVLNDLEDYWNMAYANHSRFTKKKFPREAAPLGQCPPDDVIPHETLQQVVYDAKKRLAQNIQTIEEGPKQESDHPYR